MYTSKFRDLSRNRAEKLVTREYAEIMSQHDDLELGLKRINHHFKRANKKASIYRCGRRNSLYSK